MNESTNPQQSRVALIVENSFAQLQGISIMAISIYY